MIVPSAAIKVVNFKNSQSGEKKRSPFEGCDTIGALFDSGEFAFVKITSNDKDYSSLYQYLQNKTKLAAKKSMLDKIRLSLMESDLGEKMVQGEIKASGKERKEAIMTLAKKILFEKIAVKASSIVRIPVGIDPKDGSMVSRAIIAATDRESGKYGYSNSGLYSLAVAPNHIPIEISPVVSKEGIFKDLYRVRTSMLINAAQIRSILEHSARTALKTASDDQAPFYARFFVKSTPAPSIAPLLTKANAIARSKNPSAAKEYVEALRSISYVVLSDPSVCKDIFVDFPLLLLPEDLENMYTGGKGPFSESAKAAVRLNFSKMNPDVKEAAAAWMDRKIMLAIRGGHPTFKLFSVYTLPSEDLPGTSNSWGFMKQNVDPSKTILSFSNFKGLIGAAKAQFLNTID